METETTHRKAGLSNILDKIRSNEIIFGLILSILVGVIAGFGAVIFRWLISNFQSLFFGGGANYLGFLGQYYIILIPAVGGLIVGLLVHFGAREAKGHGVPEVMKAVAVGGGRIRPRVAVIKSLASSICIGSGGSVGREGPIVQIGSSFGSAIGQWLRLPDEWLRTLVACGAAGGISATFNTPIGGVFFAMEVILGRFVTPRFGFVVISSVVADFVAHAFLGSQPSFSVVPYSMVSYWEILPYVVLGILAALAAVAFIRLLYKCEDIFDAWHIPGYLKPAIGGIAIGLIGLYSYDLFGVGYGGVFWISRMSVDQALVGEIALQSLIILLLLKIIATSLTLGSGGSGGIFAPSLFIGAMLGGALGTVAHQLFPSLTASSGAYALVGMAAVFAGATRAPITAIIMLFEMTRDYMIILPLMIAVVISLLVSRSLSRESIYTLKLVRRGIDIRELEQTSPLRKITVAEAMTRDFPTVLPTMLISDLATKLRRTGHHGFPVVDKNGKFVGVVTIFDVETAMSEGGSPNLTVDDIASKSVVVAHPDEYIHDVFVKLGTRDVGRIPVVDRDNPRRLLGVLRRHDVLTAYTKTIRHRSHQ
ncbi:MAG: chloride channel protein [Dehalococcoidia bacterium]|nr:chloride channel protein [Dehalococcoidia bacterium]